MSTFNSRVECNGCRLFCCLEGKVRNIKESGVCVATSNIFCMVATIPNCPCRTCLIKGMCSEFCEEFTRIRNQENNEKEF